MEEFFLFFLYSSLLIKKNCRTEILRTELF